MSEQTETYTYTTEIQKKPDNHNHCPKIIVENNAGSTGGIFARINGFEPLTFDFEDQSSTFELYPLPLLI